MVNQSSSGFLIFAKTSHDVWKLYSLMSRWSKATRNGGARGDWMMEVKQAWKGIFFHNANAAQSPQVILNWERAVKWKYVCPSPCLLNCGCPQINGTLNQAHVGQTQLGFNGTPNVGRAPILVKICELVMLLMGVAPNLQKPEVADCSYEWYRSLSRAHTSNLGAFHGYACTNKHLWRLIPSRGDFYSHSRAHSTLTFMQSHHIVHEAGIF